MLHLLLILYRFVPHSLQIIIIYCSLHNYRPTKTPLSNALKEFELERNQETFSLFSPKHIHQVLFQIKSRYSSNFQPISHWINRDLDNYIKQLWVTGFSLFSQVAPSPSAPRLSALAVQELNTVLTGVSIFPSLVYCGLNCLLNSSCHGDRRKEQDFEPNWHPNPFWRTDHTHWELHCPALTEQWCGLFYVPPILLHAFICSLFWHTCWTNVTRSKIS